MNRYQMEVGNPLAFVDPYGLYSYGNWKLTGIIWNEIDHVAEATFQRSAEPGFLDRHTFLWRWSCERLNQIKKFQLWGLSQNQSTPEGLKHLKEKDLNTFDRLDIEISDALGIHSAFSEGLDHLMDTPYAMATVGGGAIIGGVKEAASVIEDSAAPAIGAGASAAEECPKTGIEIEVRRPAGVTDEQWNQKMDALNKGAAEGRAKVVHNPVRNGAAQREARSSGAIKPGDDADHGLDLQYGGNDTIEEIQSTNARVNRSVGAQGKARLAHPHGTPIRNFVEKK